MEAIKAYYNGEVFVPTMPVSAKKNRTAIVTILDDKPIEPETKEPDKDGWKKFIGSISPEDCDAMMAAIEEGCEKVYPSEW